MVANNASFNCNSAKMIITGSGWPQRERFIDLLATSLAGMPTRDAYYPGAIERYKFLTRGRSGLESIGQPKQGQLPWTVIRGVDASVRDDPLFQIEPFCPIVSETSLESTDPARVPLAAATKFMNDTLVGNSQRQHRHPSRGWNETRTLAPPSTEQSPNSGTETSPSTTGPP